MPKSAPAETAWSFVSRMMFAMSSVERLPRALTCQTSRSVPRMSPRSALARSALRQPLSALRSAAGQPWTRRYRPTSRSARMPLSRLARPISARVRVVVALATADHSWLSWCWS
ncbi:hypothetical protein A4R43_01050 [Amycolatopsis albispora]|uniref:Uncharacterized protein n=1 Tax=Amycolatopsis albispora TaxID=1804986 RepID=A0A344KZQ2_9PSEU|nr:hypothetical protein A4R43_01050 [Amycolatopsis albispora]